MIALIVGVAVVVVLGVVAAVVLLPGDDKNDKNDKNSANPLDPQAQQSAPGAAPPPSPAGPPDKYPDVPTCQDVAGAVPGAPPVKQGNRGPNEGATYPEINLECTFRSESRTDGSPDQYYVFRMRVHLTDPRGYPTGTEEATGMFEAGVRNGDEEAPGLGVGQRAAWDRQVLDLPGDHPTSCPLSVLDGNATLKLDRSGAKDPTNETKDRTSQTCRAPTQEMLKRILDAVQPG